MVVERVELRPDRDLIDSNFDGYKLSLDPLPLYERNVADIDEVKLSEDLYSYQHIKSFSLHNHLHQDVWNQNQVYYVDSHWSILQVNAEQLGASFVVSEPQEVFKIPRRVPRVTGHYNVSLQFVSAEFVVVSDGAGTLYLLHADNRSGLASWQVQFKSSECVDGKAFLLLDANLDQKCTTLSCLLLHIEERASVENYDADIKSPFVNLLEWLTFQLDETGSWNLDRTRRLAGCSSIDYAALESGGHGLGVVSESRFRFIHDSAKELESDKPEVDKTPQGKTPAYAWSQTADDVSVWFKLADGVTKAQVEYKLLPTHLLFKLKSGLVVLDGPLFAAVDTEASTWTRLDNQIEVTLSKAQPGLTWSELVKGDTSGEEIVDVSLIEEIQQRLAHLTSDQLNPPSQGQQMGSMNPQQLEECDSFPVDSYVFSRFGGDSHRITNEVCLSSHQWLFSPPARPDEMPAFCVRHDVDGLLWQPGTNAAPSDGEPDWCCRHVATFNALGYVLASKTERKFLASSPTHSLVVLSDSRRHLYLYHRPRALASDLRNRKTGKRVAAVARQQVVSLESDLVLGMRVTEDCVFALTAKRLFVVRVVETVTDE